MNVFDHNALVGLTPGIANFYLANGFSGHGLQQEPAIGRGLGELIINRRYTMLDLSPLSFDRVLNNAPPGGTERRLDQDSAHGSWINAGLCDESFLRDESFLPAFVGCCWRSQR